VVTYGYKDVKSLIVRLYYFLAFLSVITHQYAKQPLYSFFQYVYLHTHGWCCRVYLIIALCYVRLYGHGLSDGGDGSQWYIAMAANGVAHVNATRGTPPYDVGFFTYIIHPGDCSASDFQHFDTFDNGGESARLISYLQALADGESLSIFTRAVLLHGWVMPLPECDVCRCVCPV